MAQDHNSKDNAIRINTVIIAVILSVFSLNASAFVYEIGDIVDDFTLQNGSGDLVSLSDFQSWAVLLSFWNAG